MAEQLMHPDPRSVVDRADAFVREHLAQCAAELVEWDGTGLLPDGRVREAAAMLRELGVGSHLEIARRLVEKQALALVASGATTTGVD